MGDTLPMVIELWNVGAEVQLVEDCLKRRACKKNYITSHVVNSWHFDIDSHWYSVGHNLLSSQIKNIIIYIGLLVAKIKSCIPRAFTKGAIMLLLPGLCDKEGNTISIARAIICDLNSARRWSLYACAHSVRADCKQTKWQPAVTHDRIKDSKMTHKALYK